MGQGLKCIVRQRINHLLPSVDTPRTGCKTEIFSTRREERLKCATARRFTPPFRHLKRAHPLVMELVPVF
jgi:hypothetical protein